MDQLEFNTYILARVLAEAGAAIVVGGGLFGFAGMLLGVPTFAVLYALVREWTYHRLKGKGIDGEGNPLPRADIKR